MLARDEVSFVYNSGTICVNEETCSRLSRVTDICVSLGARIHCMPLFWAPWTGISLHSRLTSRVPTLTGTTDRALPSAAISSTGLNVCHLTVFKKTEASRLVLAFGSLLSLQILFYLKFWTVARCAQ